MAALREAVHVCRLLSVSDLLSVDDSGLSGHIVVTQKTKSINLYKVNRKIYQSPLIVTKRVT